ncbi:MAG: leucyl aminopeptidase [Actinomycetota bacterium]|nr:leucyl aminopeptidase [Actinomycetota bacterium]
MNVRLSCAPSLPDDADAVGVLVFEGLEPADPAYPIDPQALTRRRFAGKLGDIAVTDGGDGRFVAFVGLGSRGDGLESRLRQAAAAFARSVPGCRTAALDLGALSGVPPRRAAQVVVEGVVGATYRFSAYRREDPPPSLGHVAIVVPDADLAEALAGLEVGLVIGEAMTLARDLSNTPAGDLTPARLGEIALQMAARRGLEASVLDEEQISSERLGGVLAVARGSAEPPRFVRISYEPGEGTEVPTVILVGKGITFDSGGLSLKTGEAMMTMKTDMSGAAAVIAVLGACRALGVKVKVVGLAPLTENMPGGRAQKPGDVLVARNGKTIEVLNTDAEGRLVLADALSLAAEEDPDAIIDVATLTGACVVALGRKMAGLMGNDSRLVAALKRASAAAGEPLWPLPLPEVYRSDIESEVADMKNIGSPGNAGSLVAGLLLKEFVGDRPWAHLDIAGPSRSEQDSFELRKGSTGFSVRTLCELLAGYEPIRDRADGRADEIIS